MSWKRCNRHPASAPVYVYFSGHQVEDGKKRYWLTQDARLETLAASASDTEEIRERIGKIGVSRVALVLDGPFTVVAVKSGRKTMQDAGSFLEHFMSRRKDASEKAAQKGSGLTAQVVGGLGGAADGDGDGIIKLAELTGYVAELTGYIKGIGEPSNRVRVSVHAGKILEQFRQAETRRVLELKIAGLLTNDKQAYDKQDINGASAALAEVRKLAPNHEEALALGAKWGVCRTIDLGRDVKLEMVPVMPGEFLMGSSSGGAVGGDEHQHRVKITKRFWMGKYEVTQE